MKPRIALVTVVETREPVRKLRDDYVREELDSIRWMEEYGDIVFSESVFEYCRIREIVDAVNAVRPHLLVLHVPTWTEPELSVRLAKLLEAYSPVVIGNQRKETGSMVGMLGACGSLDQVGLPHTRIFNHYLPESRIRFRQILRAAYCASELNGMVYGVFGGRSLGMVTATVDPAQWHRLFGVDIEHFDQMTLAKEAEKIDQPEVDRYVGWLKESCRGITFSDFFTPEVLEKQVRSYIATKAIVAENNLDFIGVKCQNEMSDFYTTQCLSHMLSNGSTGPEGNKETLVHACEADSDAALSMQILKLLSDGKATALLDMRWRNPEDGLWFFTNCGAMAADFASTDSDPTGLSSVEVIPHNFGRAGSCGLPMVSSKREVTLARLCRKNGIYTMFIVSGEIQDMPREVLNETTPNFPHTYIKMSAGQDFLNVYGSNHIHMVTGDVVGELEEFCRMKHLDYRVWK